MKITFQTKEESKRKQQEEFLKLTPGERVLAFFELSRRMKDFPCKKLIEKTGNFILRIDDGGFVEKQN